MLKYDDRTTVTLEDEMNFVGMYVDLLKVRFDDGFSVNIDIPDSMMPLHVIPCSVQMLIENAIKHNRLGKDCPLDIDIYAGTSGLTVENRIRPKVTAGESTKIGLSYLKRQYGSLFGKEVSVTTDNGIFSVTVPLLPPGPTLVVPELLLGPPLVVPPGVMMLPLVLLPGALLVVPLVLPEVPV